MRRYVLVAGLAAAILALSACSNPAGGDQQAPGAGTGNSSDSTSDLPAAISDAELKAAFVPALQEAGMPGGEVYVINEDGTVARQVWNDDLPRAEVRANSVLAYLSITKAFIGTVILQLAAEGALSLSDPVDKFVPNVPGGDRITINDLARMRSGLSNYSALPAMTEALSTRLDDPPALDTMLEWAYDTSPDFAPDTQYEYSNTNTLLLGKIIESTTGTSWFDAVRSRILEPLGLRSVAEGFSGGPHEATGFMVSQDAAPDPLPALAPDWLGAAGALTGNIEDLARWGEALGSGALVDDTTQFARVESLASTSDDPMSPEYDRYGFAMGEIEGWLGHTGVGMGFQSLVMHDPATHRTVAIMVNGMGDDPDVPAHIFKKLLPILNGEEQAGP